MKIDERRKFDGIPPGCYDRTAGWSSLVARWAHNPKVGGSNPPPATNFLRDLRAPVIRRFLLLSVFCPCLLKLLASFGYAPRGTLASAGLPMMAWREIERPAL